jgi:PKD repeat protein
MLLRYPAVFYTPITMKYIKSAFVLLLVVATQACVDIDKDFPVPPASTVARFDFQVLDRDNRVVKFTNTSIIPERAGSVTYTWNFGDGRTSTDAEPTHTFNTFGEFDVRLVVITSASAEVREFRRSVAVLQPFDFDFTLFYLDSDLLKIVGLSEENPSEIEVAGFGLGMAIDRAAGMLYYTDDDNDRIFRIRTDGTGRQELFSGFNRVTGIALDIPNGMMYWTSRGDKVVYRGRMDGSGDKEVVMSGLDLPDAVAVHNGKVYVSDVAAPPIGEKIYRSNLNGSGFEVFLNGIWGYALAVDEVNNRLIIEDQGDYDNPNDNRIRSVNLDNTADNITIGMLDNSGANGSRSYGIAIDHQNNKIFWTDRNTRRIRRANFDGTAAETVTVVIGSPRGLAIGD